MSRVCVRWPDYLCLFEARRRFRCAPGVGMSSCCCGLDHSECLSSVLGGFRAVVTKWGRGDKAASEKAKCIAS